MINYGQQKLLTYYYLYYYTFWTKKRPIEGKKGHFKPQKGLKKGILAQNTFSKAHIALKWLIIVHKSY